MRGVKPPAAVKAEALRCYVHEPGMTVSEIAWRADVDRKTVSGWAREAGLTARTTARPRLFSQEDDALAVRLYQERVPMVDIQARTGMSRETIRLAVKRAGVPLRSSRRAILDHDQVVALDREHGPNRAAQILGCSPGTVHYHRDLERRLRIRAEMRAEAAADAAS